MQECLIEVVYKRTTLEDDSQVVWWYDHVSNYSLHPHLLKKCIKLWSDSSQLSTKLCHVLKPDVQSIYPLLYLTDLKFFSSLRAALPGNAATCTWGKSLSVTGIDKNMNKPTHKPILTMTRMHLAAWCQISWPLQYLAIDWWVPNPKCLAGQILVCTSHI